MMHKPTLKNHFGRNFGGIYFEENRNYSYKVRRLFSWLVNIGFYIAIIFFKGTGCMEIMGRNYTPVGNSRFYFWILALSRNAVILAKYTVAAVLMTICYWISYAAAYGYTAFLWHDTGLFHVALAAFALWLAGFLYLSILMVGCVIFTQTFTSILFTGGIVVVISLLGTAKPIAKFNPFLLTSKNVDLISGEIVPSDFIIPALLSVTMSILGLLIAMKLFNKKQL